MSHPDDLIAVLDANVLYPQWLRDVMLTLAAMGYYEPRWSSQIIDEMRRNVLADHPSIDPRQFDDTTIAALHGAFPQAWVELPDDLIATMDNEPGDRHVLATAIAAHAHLVVTANTNDFQSPRYVTAGHVAIETPTDFLITVLDDHPDLMASVLLHLATRRRDVATIADVLDQLARNHALQPFADIARDRMQ
ncbi:MAG: PIN domain-containing protein [Nitriliruptor sp.]|nr:MAG: PIN domain-containing protein [Nitriliruptor sp.]